MTDPRILQLAQRRQDMAHEASGANAPWKQLHRETQAVLLSDAEEWLAAAVAAGIAPPAERPADKHSAVWVDEEGFLYGEYQTVPSSHGDALLRLVWASEMCTSKREMEDEGAEFRLLGWSQ
ncbi:hypothetical protein [Streptomyces sp. NPDC058202]|uniref:hypothetical protein n=1 Tax=Streptomyces sp. NPDC058202 TaxID=3346380 RepID=UPI0036EFC9B0